ncbi:MAG: PASTA domain-containing protein, partial [Actinomycetota bacterium]|nr:PASTA domain-containing protein [Actinomycetota bacterium]
VEAPFASPVRSPRHRSRLRRWLILMLVVLLLGVAAAAGGWWLGSGRWAYIPSAVGEPQPAAEGLVRDAGLVPQITTAPNDVVPLGTVADTEPISGSRLLRGSDVRLVVSSGRPVVPAIVAGTASEEASKLVSAADLTPAFDNSADRYDKSVPPGAVLATEPPGNTTVAVSAQVVIIRSKGPRPIPVPSVTGKSPEDARNKLLVAGFTVAAAKRVFSADFDDGSVLGTDPAVGREVSEGSPVALVLAWSLTVPAIRGESVERATADLEQAGFTVTAATPAFDADVDGGSAIGTTPASGTRVDPAGPAILLAISNAVVVPDLGQDNVGQARQQLAELGLVTDVSAMFGSAGAAVIDQSPGSGSRVQPGSTVTITAFP